MNQFKNWRDGIENIFQMHGPFVAIEAAYRMDQEVPDYARDITAASIYFRIQQYAEANQRVVPYLEVLSTLEPRIQLDAYIVRSAHAVHMTLLNDALKVLNEALNTYPEDPILLNLHATVLDKLGTISYDERFLQLVQLFGEKIEFLEAYADHLFQGFQNEKSAEIAAKILDKDPNNVKALDLLGYIELEDAHDADSYEYFRRSAEIWPYNLSKLYTLIDVALLNNDLIGAKKIYEYSLQFYPNDEKLNLDLGAFLFQTKHSDLNELVNICRKIVEHLPNNPLALYYLANALVVNQNQQEAKQILESCVTFTNAPQQARDLLNRLKIVE